MRRPRDWRPKSPTESGPTVVEIRIWLAEATVHLDVDAFFAELENADPHFAKRRDDAENQGQVLRYIATLENNQATVCLKGVDKSHPFYALTGSDNMVVFTTERYQELPLVIKGPGAGAEVTAAGIFADIIRIANYLS